MQLAMPFGAMSDCSPSRTAHSAPVLVESPLLEQLAFQLKVSDTCAGAPTPTPLMVALPLRAKPELASLLFDNEPAAVRLSEPEPTLPPATLPATSPSCAVELPVVPKKGRSQPSKLSRLMVKAPLIEVVTFNWK